jgi:hypothetical protein
MEQCRDTLNLVAAVSAVVWLGAMVWSVAAAARHSRALRRTRGLIDQLEQRLREISALQLRIQERGRGAAEGG